MPGASLGLSRSKCERALNSTRLLQQEQGICCLTIFLPQKPQNGFSTLRAAPKLNSPAALRSTQFEPTRKPDPTSSPAEPSRTPPPPSTSAFVLNRSKADAA